ncbi:helix-turn-helix transcriptional regulator [Nonomuraea gerenzanensis]|uniref:HigA protein (Antitoxin to HigB) n=1 Tax=Nonomuraea gerenzanensis TaxID=93944 RepID=A0A1M4EPZ0_9ACTN|nr:helix-turn-helix transcriptional regulator [Nonomuraea gerenzanensis]UBU12383.1 helix-turn-helix transcriptional regulator [Nonomuraea gerenzanensis]SBP00932.1 HigA protein (antitoxin to HigB) [Nonomuraea gerenzanensis]
MVWFVSASERRRDQLKEFLRAKREALAPADVGMPAAGRRRTPGLRREEVAVLAGVGVSWYTWLEQGRDIKVSDAVLDAVARALRLDEAERTHLYVLAGLNPPDPAGQPGAPVNDQLRSVLEAWMPNPAHVLDRHYDLVAMNDASRWVFGYDDDVRNCMVAFFTHPIYRGRFTAWHEFAPDMVADFRAGAARYPDDPVFGEIAAELRAVSPEFAELWARPEVRSRSQGVKAITHPEVGELVFEYSLFRLPDRADLNVVLHTPDPDTDTKEKVESLVAVHPG